QIEPLAVSERPDRRRLGLAVQQPADEPSRVDAVHGLRDRAEGAGQPEPARNDAGEFHWRRGDEPYPLPRLEMALCEIPGALPYPVGHALVVDLFGKRDDIRDLVPGDERERGLAEGIDVIGVLGAAHPE